MIKNNPRIEAGIQVIEEEMRKRYKEHGSNGEDEPSVLKPPENMYRSYEVPVFWKKVKKWLQVGGSIFAFGFLFFPLSLSFPLQGKLIANEMRVIDAKTTGEIISITKSSGDSIEKGEVIAQISNPYLHQEKKRLEAELQVLETELSGLSKLLESEQKKLFVCKRLYEEGDMARLRFEDQKTRTEDIANRFAVKDAEIYERKTKLENLDKQLEGEVVVSPVSGVITSPIREKINAHIKEGETICEVAYGGMRFEFRVKEQAVRAIQIGQKVKIRLDAFPGKKIEGRVDDIRPIVIEDNPKPWQRAYNARILVSSLTALPKESRVGMSARSRIYLKQRMSRFAMWMQNLF